MDAVLNRIPTMHSWRRTNICTALLAHSKPTHTDIIFQFDKIVLTGLGYSDRRATLMSFPEDTIQLCSVIVAGIFAQVVPNSRCALMIVANIIVLVGAVLVNSEYCYLNFEGKS